VGTGDGIAVAMRGEEIRTRLYGASGCCPFSARWKSLDAAGGDELHVAEAAKSRTAYDRLSLDEKVLVAFWSL
jgi:hypothetical protein